MEITLSPLEAADIPHIHRAMQDWQMVRWLTAVPWPYTVADAEMFVHEQATAQDRTIRVDGGFAGMLRGGGDLGYWLGQEFRGRGIAFKAAAMALAEGFAAGLGSVSASHIMGNDRSAVLLARLGFRRVGSMRALSRPLGREVALARLQLDADDFGMRHPIRIATPRTVMDPLRAEDAQALRDIVTVPEIGRMLFIFAPDLGTEAAAEIIMRNRWRGAPPFRLAIRQAGRLIGSIGVGDGAEPSIFYFLAPGTGGQGLGSEIVPAFCNALFARFPLAALRAEVFTDNPVSARILQKAGFREYGMTQIKSAARPDPAPAWVFRLPRQN